jgi:hypothetical protein
MKEIKLSRTGYKHKGDAVAIVDDEDYEWLIQFNWHIKKADPKRNTGYALGIVNGKNSRMHRVIMGATDPKVQVDHINGNGLDNRRCNLRLASNSQNHMNTKKIKGCTSKYKGVVWHKKRQKWQTQIVADSKYMYIGVFDLEEDAARAYNEFAVACHGKFARLNIIGGDNEIN